MDKDIIVGITSILVGVFSSIITNWFTNITRKNQNKYEDAKLNLPILIQILEELRILQQALLFAGKFCPYLEHRCPKLSENDGDCVTNMSFAQRGHQFQIIGYRLMENCRKIIFLTPKENIPNVVENCRKIISFLSLKRSSDSKIFLENLICDLIVVMSGMKSENNSIAKMKQTADSFDGFHSDLEKAIEKDLPRLNR